DAGRLSHLRTTDVRPCRDRARHEADGDVRHATYGNALEQFLVQRALRGARARVDDRGATDDSDLVLKLPDLQRRVDRGREARAERDARAANRLESFERERHRVFARTEVDDPESP